MPGPNDVSQSDPNSNAALCSTWEDDPGAPDTRGVLVSVPFPLIEDQPLPTKIVMNPAPARDRFPEGTPGFRFWGAAAALRRCSDFWGAILPQKATWNPSVGPTLDVILDAGIDLNAFYDRQALTFFHGTVLGSTVFSGESPDIVSHEYGHAVLDSIGAGLWNAMSIEVDAFHESFGDMSAILVNLQLPSMRAAVLAETEGHLNRSSRLSRLAEQLGWAIRQFSASAVEHDCLRNAANSFFYQSADELPTSGPATMLTSEPHSFSRVFTAAFLDALAGMFASRPGQKEEDLLEVSRDMASLLVEAVRSSPIVPSYMSQVGAHLLRAAMKKDQGYAEAIKVGLVRHGLLSIPGAVTVATAHAPVGVAAGLGGQPVPHDLDVSGYGLKVPTIRVQAPSAQRRFSVAGASKSVGDVAVASPEDAARAFFEDLLRRGRLDPKGFADPALTVFDRSSFKTHELVDEQGTVTLYRRRIDCIPRRPQPAQL
ncbi:hypothetical protein predicted by Glimmer/Critica [Sorangium cellulosum So ce56]|uniref:Peptidase M4 domain-containing protein n=1 Tax=Sorangium cellulosum (strain So ce56) TaxID=448385 RepID=A9GV21_SORC5|nr:hypothetical protein [Sorangium cellulosum]CAN90694.1 hypothetical protein predicted by Glimmer/Critica [Sorangium cellulosum So ce56]